MTFLAGLLFQKVSLQVFFGEEDLDLFNYFPSGVPSNASPPPPLQKGELVQEIQGSFSEFGELEKSIWSILKKRDNKILGFFKSLKNQVWKMSPTKAYELKKPENKAEVSM